MIHVYNMARLGTVVKGSSILEEYLREEQVHNLKADLML